MQVLKPLVATLRAVLCFVVTLWLLACKPVGMGAGSEDENDDAVLDPVTSSICEASETGQCWYAAPGATGAGTIDDPGQLQTLLPLLGGGDVLYLFEGAYTDYVSEDDSAFILELNKYFNFQPPEPTAENPVLIRAYPTHEAIIQGDGERRCILIDGQSHVTFQNLVVEHCFNEGMRIGWDIPEEGIRLTGMTFRNIEYFDNPGFIYIQGYHGVVIEDSTFYDYVPSETGQRGSYVQTFQATDLTIRNNHFSGDGGGLYYKHGESEPGKGGYTRIYGNLFEDLALHGVYTNQNRTEIYDNFFVNTDGIKVHQEDGTRPPFTQDVDIHHNTLISSGIVLNQGSNTGSYLDAYGLGAKHAIVRNNLLIDSDYRIWVYGTDEQFDEGINLQSYDNCFDVSGGTMSFLFFSSDTHGGKGGSYPLSQWQLLGYDSQSLETSLPLDASHQLPAGHACQFAGRRSVGD